MSLQDVISNMDLSLYPQVALVLFAAAWLGVLLRITRRGARDELARAAALPLDEGRAAREDYDER